MIPSENFIFTAGLLCPAVGTFLPRALFLLQWNSDDVMTQILEEGSLGVKSLPETIQI